MLASFKSKRWVTCAVADIHCRLDLLGMRLDMITADAAAPGARAKIVFTGDYVDRGQNSLGVVERLMAGPQREGDRFLCLRGNHEDLFLRSVTTGSMVPDWARILFGHTLDRYETAPESPAGTSHAPALNQDQG